MVFKDPEKTRKYHRFYHRLRYDAAIAIFLNYLGNRCVQCGSQDQLEFDHIDPTSKAFTITTKWNKSFEYVQPELDKCQLLCTGCHKTKTLTDKNLQSAMNGKHGTTSTYRYCGPPKCDACKAARLAYHHE